MDLVLYLFGIIKVNLFLFFVLRSLELVCKDVKVGERYRCGECRLKEFKVYEVSV